MQFKYYSHFEKWASSSVRTTSSVSLSMKDESSLTSILSTSRARTGAPRVDSAAKVNWISLLFSQWRTKLLWFSLEMESSDDSIGMSLKAFTAAATWNCKVELSWRRSNGSVDVSSRDCPVCECHKHLLPFSFECEIGSLWSPCLTVSHQMRQTLSVQDVSRQLTTVELKMLVTGKNIDYYMLRAWYRFYSRVFNTLSRTSEFTTAWAIWY